MSGPSVPKPQSRASASSPPAWRRWLVLALALAIALLSRYLVSIQGTTGPGPSTSTGAAPTGATATGSLAGRIGGDRDVVVNLFQWTWRSVAAECPRLAQAGYAGVQVSPATEHAMVFGNPWYVDYQPVSYQLLTRRGDRAAFAAMIQACHAAGVRVYADVVVNHMAGSDGGVGYAGTAWSHYDYSGLYGPQDFHHCGLAPGDEIENYQDRAQVQTCELVNLADLATDTEPVRARIAAYLGDLASLGVDGLRVDAAKHIPATDLADILRRVPGSLDVYTEVIDYGTEPIHASEYAGFAKVLVFTYGPQVGAAVQSGHLASLRQLAGPVDGTRARVFLDNHDTQRHGGPRREPQGSLRPPVRALPGAVPGHQQHSACAGRHPVREPGIALGAAPDEIQSGPEAGHDTMGRNGHLHGDEEANAPGFLRLPARKGDGDQAGLGPGSWPQRADRVQIPDQLS